MTEKLYGTVLLKARQILDYLASTTEAPTLSELDEHLNISKPTIYKIIQTLEYCGYVRTIVNGDQKTYRLGTVFLHYAQTVNDSIDIVEIATPFLKTLRDQTAETVNLGIEQDDKIVLLSKMESTHSIKLVSVIGGTMNMYSSAMGKALLATYSPQHLANYFQRVHFERLTPNTIVDQTALQRDLAAVRERGYAIDNVENQPGVYCLGFAIVAHHRTYGAFSISTPEFRLTTDKRTAFVRLGKRTQKLIQQHL
ncbi:IclR family transcriptional regulator [Limosilactobacillus sp.]|jgi:DNA-binding IclR family transcriptional regulator|uniref:IclR family transcriptional regulator n=1 Tax=Limosilactobacillus sp. TaxID=2773925 RepID=UPI0025C0DE4D|nr:IclR family transcriptional regulator [Limosilactobacillus sp.]MCH3923009.1 IclR family transcriptional regulator [Limosilactobacillus sp.]MCH3927692.1 IclR family transcriptional regulator [Limosilactobacillus sp.]